MANYQRISPGMYRAPSGRTVTQQQMQRGMQRHPGRGMAPSGQPQQMPQQQMQQNWNQVGAQLGAAPLSDRYQQGVQDIANMRGASNQQFMDNNEIAPSRFNQMFGGQMMQPRQNGGASIDPGFSMDPNQMHQMMQKGWGQGMAPDYAQQQYQPAPPPQMQFRRGTSGHEMMLARNAKTNQQRAKFGVVNQQPQGLLSLPPNMAGRNQY